MSYEVTATRKRPRDFETLAGQEFVVATLQNAIRTGRIAHAYLFSGPRGVGKTSSARIVARALNCEQGPTANPCGVCSHCTEIQTGSSMDVIEIDGASNTSVNDIREIKDEVLFAPNSCRYKIYIIDEVHMLSNSAFNALLKTIEEPPPYIIFIFATTEIHKVPATIRSRCQQFNFRLIPAETIRDLLSRISQESGIRAEEDALFWIAKEATGSLRDAYTLYDQVVAFSDDHITLEKIREKLGLVGLDQINDLAALLIASDREKALLELDKILTQGISAEQFIIDLTEYFRSLLFIKSGITRESLLGYRKERFHPEAVATLTTSQLEAAIDTLLTLYRDIRFSLNQRFELELLISKLCDITRYFTHKELYGMISALQQQLGGAPAPMGEALTFSTGTQPPAPDLGQGNPQSARPDEKKKNPLTAFRESIAQDDNPFKRNSSPAAQQNGPAQLTQQSRPVTTGQSEPVPESEPTQPISFKNSPPAGMNESPHSKINPYKEQPAAKTHAQGNSTTQQQEAPAAGMLSPDALPDQRKKELLLDSLDCHNQPALCSSLNQAERWDFEPNRVTIYFKSHFHLDIVSQNLKILESASEKILNKPVAFRVAIDDSRNSQQAEPRQDAAVDMVVNVFKGQIVRD